MQLCYPLLWMAFPSWTQYQTHTSVLADAFTAWLLSPLGASHLAAKGMEGDPFALCHWAVLFEPNEAFPVSVATAAGLIQIAPLENGFPSLSASLSISPWGWVPHLQDRSPQLSGGSITVYEMMHCPLFQDKHGWPWGEVKDQILRAISGLANWHFGTFSETSYNLVIYLESGWHIFVDIGAKVQLLLRGL